MLTDNKGLTKLGYGQDHALVNHSVVLEKDLVSTMTETCGRRGSTSYHSANLLQSLVSRFQERKDLVGFKRLQSDMETLGKASAAIDLPAGGFGACHRRNRIYWVSEDVTNTQRNIKPREEQRSGEVRRMGGFEQPFPWDTPWTSALRRIRVVDDGLSYGVASADAARNAVVPQVAKAFIETYYGSR